MEVYYEKTKINAYYYDYFFARNNFIKNLWRKIDVVKKLYRNFYGKTDYISR